jgi:hypothetical protein
VAGEGVDDLPAELAARAGDQDTHALPARLVAAG